MKKVEIHPDFTFIIPDNKIFEIRGCKITKKNGHITIEFLDSDFSKFGVFKAPDAIISNNFFQTLP